MSSGDSVTSYDTEGRIKQVEYAMITVNLGTTTIGVKLDDCVIIVSERKLTNKLQIPQSVKKHFKIYDKILMGCSGIITDAPTIIDRCMSLCINHESIFGEQMPIKELKNEICAMALQFSESDIHRKIYSRPFGVSMLLASHENEETKLFCIDPSGSSVSYKAYSIGSGQETVNSQLEENFSSFTDKDTTIKILIKILRNVMKDELDSNNVEISTVSNEGVV